MYRNKPYIITFNAPNTNIISQFALDFAVDLLKRIDQDPTSIYSTSSFKTFPGYSSQFCTILNNVFDNFENIPSQYNFIKQLSDTSTVQVSENRYKEPVFFKSNILIIITNNIYPHIAENYNFLHFISDYVFKYVREANRFYQPSIINNPSFSQLDHNTFYHNYYERTFVYIKGKQIDQGLTKQQVRDVTYDSYINHVGRCT